VKFSLGLTEGVINSVHEFLLMLPSCDVLKAGRQCCYKQVAFCTSDCNQWCSPGGCALPCGSPEAVVCCLGLVCSSKHLCLALPRFDTSAVAPASTLNKLACLHHWLQWYLVWNYCARIEDSPMLQYNTIQYNRSLMITATIMQFYLKFPVSRELTALANNYVYGLQNPTKNAT